VVLRRNKRIGIRALIVMALASVVVSACTDQADESQAASSQPSQAPVRTLVDSGDRSSARNTTDDAATSSRLTLDPPTFHGYACTNLSCSGQRTGYAWAEEHGIDNPDDCPIDPHNSHSLTEGCWAEAGREGP